MKRTELPTGQAEKRILQFGELRVDPVRRLLLRNGEVVPITPKAFALLLVLLERRGEVVDKKELIEQVWPDTFVTEANLTQNISSLRKVLGERAGDRRYVVTLPGKGYSFVAEVSEVTAEIAVARPEPVPADLPASAELPAVPSDEGTGPVAVMPPWVRRFRRRAAASGIVLLAAIAAVALLLLGAPGATDLSQEVVPAAPAATVRRPSIAVLGFRNLAGDDELSSWLAPALTEMLTTELAAGGRVRVVSGESVARARQSLSLPYTDSLAGGSLRQLHSLLDADRVILGSFLSLPGAGGRRVRLDLRVIELPSGTPLASLTEKGTEPELFDLVSRAGAGLRQALGIAEPSAEQVRAVQALRPATPEAARFYAQGLARQRAFDFPGARDLFLQAAAADPASAAIHTALSRTWLELGDDARSVEEARRALELAASLPREERLATEARLYEASQRWSKAGEIYRSLWTFFPDEIEYGLRLAICLSYAGRNREALETIRSLRRLPPPAGEDPRIDIAEARTAVRLSDTAAAKQATEAAIRKGRKSGEVLLVADAMVLQGGALLIEGDVRTALARFHEARELEEQSGHALGVAVALAYTGIALQRLGELDSAEKVFLESLGITRRLGSSRNVAAQLGNLGRLYLTRGKLDQAYEYLEEARVRFSRVEEPLLELRVLSSLGTLLAVRGELDSAAKRLGEVIALSHKMGSPLDEGRAMAELATVLAAQGHLDEARRQGERALHLMGLMGRLRYPGATAAALAASADVLVLLGDLPLARQRYDRALALRRQEGDRIGEGQVLGALARLALREGGVPRARQLVREQLELARTTGARPVEAAALRHLGNVELAEGDLVRARTSLEASLEASVAVGEALHAAAVRLDLARLDLAAGRPAEAARRARKVAAWAAPRGAAGLESEALAVARDARDRGLTPAERRTL